MITEINIVNEDLLLHELIGQDVAFATQPHALREVIEFPPKKHFCLPLSLACGTNMVKNISA